MREPVAGAAAPTITRAERRNRDATSLDTPTRYAGYIVRDPRRRKIGKLKKAYLNDFKEPEYLEVSVGFFGSKTLLIPVETVVVDEERRALILE